MQVLREKKGPLTGDNLEKEKSWPEIFNLEGERGRFCIHQTGGKPSLCLPGPEGFGGRGHRSQRKVSLLVGRVYQDRGRSGKEMRVL